LPLKIAIGISFHSISRIQQVLVTVLLRQRPQVIGLIEAAVQDRLLVGQRLIRAGTIGWHLN